MAERDMVVVDIDGVIGFPDEERMKLIGPDGKANWEKFYACDFTKDKFNPQMVALITAFSFRGLRIVVSTSRSERVRDQTEAWLNRVLVGGFWKLVMRAEGDWRPASVVKPENLFRADIRPSSVLMAIDDEAEVVAALRDAGYATMHYGIK